MNLISDLNGNQVANKSKIPAIADDIALTIGPAPFLNVVDSPKPLIDKNNSFVSKTHNTHKNKSTAKAVLSTLSDPDHDFLNDSRNKTIAIAKGKTNPKTGIIVPL
mgnify:CR=1 FL=1